MRRVEFGPLARSISAIGFGCASLGSRVDGKRGMAALARAYDAGVTWFDVAPSYGDGHAEVLLGKFLAGKRSHVAVCTKVGIVPGRVSLAIRIAKPVVQWAIVLRPELRKHVTSFRPPAQRVELTGPLIESSIVESLTRRARDRGVVGSDPPDAKRGIPSLNGDASLASVANWADESRPERDETYNWHFVDIPDSASGCSDERVFSAQQQAQGRGNRPSQLRGGSDRNIQAGSLRQQCFAG